MSAALVDAARGGTAAAARDGVAQVVTFALAADLFAFDVRHVERVIRYRAPVAVPRMPDWATGMLESRYGSFAVVDLRRRFSMPGAPADVEPRIVVVPGDGGRIGVVVDRVLDVAVVAPGHLDAAPPLFRGLTADYLIGILRRDGPPALVLDATRLLTATERLALHAAMPDA